MVSRFATTPIGNILHPLSDDDALRVIALSSATNDLALNLEALDRFPESENMYFFVTSLSILRELAKLISGIEEHCFRGKMTSETKKLLQEVNSELARFDAGSLVKDVLKPLRDVTFHYDHVNATGSAKPLIEQALSQIKAEKSLEIGFDAEGRSALGQRYIFADRFRSSMLNQQLNSELVSTISAVAVNIVALVDSLLADLNRK